jgi:hypothetical protein
LQPPAIHYILLSPAAKAIEIMTSNFAQDQTPTSDWQWIFDRKASYTRLTLSQLFEQVILCLQPSYMVEKIFG